VIASVAAFNAVPLAGALWLGWDVTLLMLLYWAENVAAGVFIAVRMIASGVANGAGGLGVMTIGVPFLILHYGAFCAVHLLIVTTAFLGAPTPSALDSGAVFAEGPALLWKSQALWGLAALVAPQALSTVAWLRRGEAKRGDPAAHMGRRYAVTVLLHLAIILTGALAVALGQPLWSVVVLVATKTAWDLWSETRRGRALLGSAQAA